ARSHSAERGRGNAGSDPTPARSVPRRRWRPPLAQPCARYSPPRRQHPPADPNRGGHRRNPPPRAVGIPEQVGDREPAQRGRGALNKAAATEFSHLRDLKLFQHPVKQVRLAVLGIGEEADQRVLAGLQVDLNDVELIMGERGHSTKRNSGGGPSGFSAQRASSSAVFPGSSRARNSSWNWFAVFSTGMTW